MNAYELEHVEEMRALLSEVLDDDYPDYELPVTASDLATLLCIIDSLTYRIKTLEASK